MSRDPLGEAGGLNLYGYAGGDPINHFDPNGLAPGDWWDIRTIPYTWAEQNPFNRRSSLYSTMYSIHEGSAALLHGDVLRASRAYDYGVFGQTQNSDPVTYYGTRGAVGVATIAGGGAMCAVAGPSVVAGGRAAAGAIGRGAVAANGAAGRAAYSTGYWIGNSTIPYHAGNAALGGLGNLAMSSAAGGVHNGWDAAEAFSEGAVQGIVGGKGKVPSVSIGRAMGAGAAGGAVHWGFNWLRK